MKTITRLSLIALMLIIGVNVSAQENALSFGVKAGVNMSNASFGGDADNKAKFGFQAGAFVEYGLPINFFLQSGLYFTTKGVKVDDVGFDVIGTTDTSWNLSYIQLPIYGGYRINVADNTNIVFNFGPYLAYGVSGKIKIDGVSEKYNLYKKYDGDDAMLKRFDFGLGAGVGAEFGKILVNLGYELGLANLANDDDGKFRNRNASLTVGYRF